MALRWLARGRSGGADGSRETLRLLPVWAALGGTFAVALGTVALLVWTGTRLLDVEAFRPEPRLTSQTLFDLLRIAFSVVAGIGGVVALVVAYRRQRVTESAARREETRLLTERFTTAAGQLGDEQPAVRLAGAHALFHLADDAPTRELRQMCIDVLCAYLRMPYEPAPPEDDDSDGAMERRLTYGALREVRHTIVRGITEHLRDGAPVSWRGHDFDFTGAVFDAGDFSRAVFSTGSVSFRHATFADGPVNFRRARFAGATVDFGKAEFTGGGVYFRHAEFTDGWVNFDKARFTGATVNFGKARFAGATVDFTGIVLTGGTILFDEAESVAGSLDFGDARFSGGTVVFSPFRVSASSLLFAGAHFAAGTVDFREARFDSGTVDFVSATGTCPDGLAEATTTGGVVRLPAAWRSSGDA